MAAGKERSGDSISLRAIIHPNPHHENQVCELSECTVTLVCLSLK